MAYTRQTHVDGTVLRAAALNHIEDGLVAQENEIGALASQLSEAVTEDTTGMKVNTIDGSGEGIVVLNVVDETARQNIAAVENSKAVRYDQAQTLTDAQKTTARSNVGAASATEVEDLKSAIGYEETTVSVPTTKQQGGFTGDVGEEITFNAQSAWRSYSFVPDSDKTYHITFTNRANISTRYYVYGVDADGIILGRYAEVAQSSTSETKEFDLSFASTIKTVWVCGSNGSSSQPITVSYTTLITRVDPLETDVDALKDAVFPDTSAFDKGPFNTFRQDFDDYYTGKNNDYSAFDSSTTYSDVIAAFDALMALDPSHISKTSLGVGSGTDDGGNQYTLYEYAFTPYAYTNAGLTGFAKNPTILMDGSIHGFEKNSTYAIYYFLRDVILNFHNDPVLTAIRNNVVLKIVPVTNPYGFDRGSYINANGVNINRNFYTSDWRSVTDSQTGNSGLEAFDQPESTIIRDWVLDNLSDITCYYNVHTNGRVVHSYMDMNACMPKFGRTDGDTFFDRLKYVIKRHIQRQTAYIPKAYDLDVPSTEFVGKYQNETGSFGTAAIWAAEQAKIVSMTLELFVGVTVNQDVIIAQYANESKKICSEMLGNIIAETIFEYSEQPIF